MSSKYLSNGVLHAPKFHHYSQKKKNNRLAITNQGGQKNHIGKTTEFFFA